MFMAVVIIVSGCVLFWLLRPPVKESAYSSLPRESDKEMKTATAVLHSRK